MRDALIAYWYDLGRDHCRNLAAAAGILFLLFVTLALAG